MILILKVLGPHFENYWGFQVEGKALVYPWGCEITNNFQLEEMEMVRRYQLRVYPDIMCWALHVSWTLYFVPEGSVQLLFKGQVLTICRIDLIKEFPSSVSWVLTTYTEKSVSGLVSFSVPWNLISQTSIKEVLLFQLHRRTGTSFCDSQLSNSCVATQHAQCRLWVKHFNF